MPEDAKEASGYGVRAKRSKSGAIGFEILELEAGLADWVCAFERPPTQKR